MKQKLFILSFTFSVITINAQQWQVGFGYKYIYSGQWDKCIQTYNFSRPFLKLKQPLLINGFGATTSFLFKNSKKLKHGIDLSYSYFGSKVVNENYTNKLNLNLLNIAYLLSYQNPYKLKRVSFDLGVSVMLGILFRKVNKAAYKYDDQKMKALGIGGSVNLRVNYKINLSDKYHLAPFICIGYTPYYFNPKTEALINQTTELVSRNWTGVFTSQIGFSAYLNKSSN
jgi:hypothetical protein